MKSAENLIEQLKALPFFDKTTVRQLGKQLGMDTTIDHVTDFSQIAVYGVMTTPALVVDGKVVSYGKVLKTDEVVKLLQKARGRKI
ncbi:MAG: thioredoxin family protein [Candidatus Ratteibacteria bacterium]|jgi:hypothetical protein